MVKTIRDVAIQANVSITTVSHVINKTRYVSTELQERVMHAIEELGYHPNELARGLRRGDTTTIGLVLPDNSNPFFAETSRYIEDIGFENGYSVILCNSADDLAREASYAKTLIAKQVDGVIFIASHNKPDNLMDFYHRDIPVVIVDRDFPLNFGDVVLVNNQQGGYLAGNYLAELGHRRIACVSGPSDLMISVNRVRGFTRAMADAGIPIEEDYMISGDFRYSSGEQTMQALLALPHHPTAVFLCNDMMAIGAKRYLHNVGMAVPKDISIIGFDNISFASAVSPSLTTIAQPMRDIAQQAIGMLIERIQKGNACREPKRVVLDTELIVRESCAALN